MAMLVETVCTLFLVMVIKLTSWDGSRLVFFPLFLFPKHLVIKRYCEFVEEAPEDQGLKTVLARLGSLFSLWRLNNHIGLLYQGMHNN